MSKARTPEELRENLLAHCRWLANYWAKERPHDVKAACEGVAFSILTYLDGCSSSPSFDLVLRPHPDDKQFHIDNGDDWIEDGTVINADCYLHEMFYKKDIPLAHVESGA